MRNELPKGDPEGRRIAKRRALLLSEAAKVGQLFINLLMRAGQNTDACESLIRSLGGIEHSQLIKSYGRIESRKRFKKLSSQPLLDKRKTNALYVDENGKSKPEPLTGPTFFSVGAVAMETDDIERYIIDANRLKQKFFGRTDLTFHEPHMRNHEGLYYFKGDGAKQNAFNDALNDLIVSTQFVVFGVGVRKHAYADFMDKNLDPYLPSDVYSLAIELLMERYVDYLAARDDKMLGRVTFESQGPKEDVEHQLGYAQLLLNGTQWLSGSDFRNWLEAGLIFTPKSNSNPTELADMFSRDLYEWVRSDCEAEPLRWEVFGKKIYCRGDGSRGKFGVKIFPDSDIRSRIEAHRIQCGAEFTEN